MARRSQGLAAARWPRRESHSLVTSFVRPSAVRAGDNASFLRRAVFINPLIIFLNCHAVETSSEYGIRLTSYARQWTGHFPNCESTLHFLSHWFTFLTSECLPRQVPRRPCCRCSRTARPTSARTRC